MTRSFDTSQVVSRSPVPLERFGAKGNGTDSIVPAFNAAVNALSGAQRIVLPAGFCRVDGPLVLPSGWSIEPATPETFLYAPVHGFDMVIAPNGTGNIVLDGVRWLADAPSSGTGCYFLRNESDSFRAFNLDMRGGWSGIFSSGAKAEFYSPYIGYMKTSVGIHMLIDMGSNEVCIVRDLLTENPVGQEARAAAKIVSGSAIYLGGIGTRCTYGVLVEPGVGQVVASLIFEDFNGDNCTGQGALFGGSGAIQRVRGRLITTTCAAGGTYVTNPLASAEGLDIVSHNNSLFGLRLCPGSHKGSAYNLYGGGNTTNNFQTDDGALNWRAFTYTGSGFDDLPASGGWNALIGATNNNYFLGAFGEGVSGNLFNGSSGAASKLIQQLP